MIVTKNPDGKDLIYIQMLTDNNKNIHVWKYLTYPLLLVLVPLIWKLANKRYIKGEKHLLAKDVLPKKPFQKV